MAVSRVDHHSVTTPGVGKVSHFAQRAHDCPAVSAKSKSTLRHRVITQAVARDVSQPCRRQRFRRLHARDGRRLQNLRAIQTASLQMKAHEIRHVFGRGIDRA